MPPRHTPLTSPLLICLWLSTTIGQARAFERLDDSASPRQHIAAVQALDENGRPLASSLGARQALIHYGRIEVRLNTAPYLGRRARIYGVLPPMLPGVLTPTALRLSWRGGRLFDSGQLRPDEPALVWAGIVTTPVMSDSLDLRVLLDLQQVQLQQGQLPNAALRFEIEVLP